MDLTKNIVESCGSVRYYGSIRTGQRYFQYDKFTHLPKAATNAEAIASQFLFTSLHLYHELDLTEKAIEVEQLLGTLHSPSQ